MRELRKQAECSISLLIVARFLRSVSFGFLLVITIAVSNSPAQYRFDHWTTDEGLPQNGVRQIVQTPDGYLWFTTFDGLVRFDGMRFTVFNKSNTSGIPSNRFANLCVDERGTLWASTEQGELTQLHDGVFTSYALHEGLPRGWANLFKRDANGEWMIRTDRGYFYLHGGNFTPASLPYNAPHTEFYLGPSGTQWIADENGINQIKDGRTNYNPLKPDNGSTKADSFSLYEDTHGSLWAGDSTGLYRLQDGNITRYTLAASRLPRMLLRPSVEDAEGGIWCAAGFPSEPSVGLLRFKDGKFTVWGAATGLSNNLVYELFKDREGTIWVATNRGLNRLRQQLITSYSTESGLADKEVYPIYQDSKGTIWIGARGLTVYRDGKFIDMLAQEAVHQTYPVQSLFEDTTGRLWVGVVGGFTWYENGKLRDPGDLIKASAWAIRADRNGDVWVASTNGLFKFKDDKIIAHYAAGSGLPSDDVKVIHESSDGTMWFGTYGGLAALKDDKFYSWTTKDGLASDRVRSIYEGADGTLWIGTYDGGLSRFRDGKFFNYTIENGLFNNGVFCILEDKRSNYWISCNRGIYRVNRNELDDLADGKSTQINCVVYGKSDGMLNTECNGGRQPAGLIAADGKLWFPTQDGVVVIDPDAATANPLPPPVEIETVAIDREHTTPEKLQSAISNPQSAITMSPRQTSLDITYTALSLIKSDQLRFKYKLEGLDKDWVDAGMRRTAYYSYLPPGEYTFKVIAANADGVWNNEGRAIKVIVIPPVYRRGWFVALAITATFSLMLFIYRLRVSQLKRERAAQHEFSRQLISSQELERKRIAAELHDSLGQTLLVIKNRAYMGARTAGSGNAAPEEARQQFDEISGSATEAIDQVREISYYLRPSQLERLGLTAALEEMLDQVAESSGIAVIFDISPLNGAFSSESEINFYRIVQECANNIVKHSAATQAEVHISRDAHGVELMVHDNGNGFDMHAAQTNSSRKSGFGLTGIAERVRILGGRHAIESAPGSGTTVKVRIDRREEPTEGSQGKAR